MDRELSGVFFREQRNGKWENVCFEDLSEESQDKIIKEKSPEFIGNLAKRLAQCLKEIGDKFDIVSQY